ncbi:RagB/SusD family nutrient uptake outer membrane protein [Pseudoflavitalea sp. G-6-1-2]|uniref:RagB/SusD family nutrient uptake outer membrane protein n=1 Tax=Pseudoflavitalea sp. G-6-1-2 TaxID=2728841 RepID=UPI00146B7E50|nr:RagB/SusD family nutrient uptake outer membrane protein [Pseudoflavitalea sp. G-6-1-2]NML23480.1 RagB/SusD family nutrient uptake outer membrane protein [Pseudoflavitalea sp. G-6-1-2]
MNKYKMALLGLGFSAITLGGCSDKFLDVADKGNLSESTFWTNRQQAIWGITATYGALQGNTGDKWAFYEQLFVGLTYKSDEVDNNKNEPYGKELAAFVNGADDYATAGVWSTFYAGIGRANQVIDNVPGITAMSEAERKELVAEAKFLRAYNYFMLVNGFENVPLVTKYEKDITKLKRKAAPPAEVWALIEADLKEAEATLPDNYVDAGMQGRATRNAAKAMLGKVYLYQEKWPEAEAKLGEVYGKYSLLTNFVDNFNGKAENGPESIFEIQFSGDRSVADERHPLNFELTPYPLGGWDEISVSPWLESEMRKDLKTNGTYSDRIYNSIFFDDPNSKMLDLGSPQTLTSYADVKADLREKAYFTKYTYPTDKGGSYTGVNITIIRYADVLLMLAEAKNENGKTGEAVDLINEVRRRSHAKELVAADFNKTTLRTHIRHHERPVELSMEWGIRWFDLVRWGRGNTAKESIKATLQLHNKPFANNFDDKKHIRYAIPSAERAANPLVDQNFGY